ncbi:ImmA/IrrE family metallo-endopeptidase [Virgibacillus salexigens]|uniref:IrrE N-terminal-like domain-containing protein n=1 Tax=Virgibacillus kapii TaxID=1638645 RepID=A0ABQ2DL63_9BACI|nr:ImmA/IrrE family metallo-endopeptidase [Virgibacillus kapii]GGJ61731.1 hypothetical protein GCM10007111_24810 [Virgibacillus kapii]
MYETLVQEAFDNNVVVEERYMSKRNKGLYGDNVIWINKNLETLVERTCVIAEELYHHYFTIGDITELSVIQNLKQEHFARRRAAKRLVTLEGLVEAYKNYCYSKYEIAEYLRVTEPFLEMSIKYYHEKYGREVRVDDKHVLFLDPLGVFEDIK